MVSPEKIEELVEEASQVQEKAYAPYSNFKVGAALLGKSGAIFTGCNVENASYGMTMCAERNAVAHAVASGEREFSALAIVTDALKPTPPCGACRQVLVEFSPDMDVILVTTQGQRKTFSLKDLLPYLFEFKK
jgi:cytidine deaminase